MSLFQPLGSKSQPIVLQSESDELPVHARSIEACLAALRTSLKGLDSAEAEGRLKAQGTPTQSGSIQTQAPKIFLNHLKKMVSLLFIAAAALSFSMGQPVDGLLILAAWLINGAVQGLLQWKSVQSQQNWMDTHAVRCQVRRDGKSMVIPACELVCGDILLIEGGQVMPADARLISAYQMQVDESLLTGESVLMPKNSQARLHSLEDVTAQCNMLFAGTIVKTGKGEALVTALGEHTVMGKIAALAQTTEKRESRFTRQLNQTSLVIFLAVLALIGAVIAIGVQRHVPLTLLIQVGLVMGIAAFPETIPGLASLVMSMGIARLQEKKVLIKNFQALETMGDVQVICTDKTGTLTENYLIFDQVFLPGLGVLPYDPQWQTGENFPCQSVEEFLRIGRLNNGTMAEGLRSALMGDPIDVAIFRAAPASLEIGYHPRVSIPFDAVSLRSATLCESPGGQIVSMIKGAPESVMEICKYYMKPDGSIAEMSLTQRSEFLMFNRKLAYEQNLRVIGFARKPMVEDDVTGPYRDATFVGWVCLLDPAKPGVSDAIASLLATGAQLIMITGDQKATAEITARELGIISRNSDQVWLRMDLEANFENSGQADIPETVRVFARTKPEEKLAIVESLQRSGSIVAMVGDGVNDSPALQRSDVAIAMGLQGSAAAKDSADIILMNDRLEGILHVIIESRLLRRKVQSCIRYVLSCNLGLILFVAAASLSGLGLPINVVQLLWLNLLIVSVPALVLAVEPTREEPAALMEEHRQSIAKQSKSKKTQHDGQAPLDSTHLFLVCYWATLIMLAGLGAVLLCLHAFKLSAAESGTAAFCAVAVAQTLNLFNVQALNAGERRGMLMAELASTPITWIVLATALLLQASSVYMPGLNTMLGTAAMSPQAALVAVGLGVGAVLFSLKTMKVG
jgi:Ca2+-transporting ATPase